MSLRATALLAGAPFLTACHLAALPVAGGACGWLAYVQVFDETVKVSEETLQLIGQETYDRQGGVP